MTSSGRGFLSRETSGIVTFSCFTETWLSRDMLSESVQPPGIFVRRVDRNKHLSKGVCFMINNSWCNCNNIQELKSFCSPDLEFLTIKCRPYYLPREFTVTAVYITPQADTTTALKELHWTLCKLETIYPEAALVVDGDFNKANLRTRQTICPPGHLQHLMSQESKKDNQEQ